MEAEKTEMKEIKKEKSLEYKDSFVVLKNSPSLRFNNLIYDNSSNKLIFIEKKNLILVSLTEFENFIQKKYYYDEKNLQIKLFENYDEKSNSDDTDIMNIGMVYLPKKYNLNVLNICYRKGFSLWFTKDKLKCFYKFDIQKFFKNFSIDFYITSYGYFFSKKSNSPFILIGFSDSTICCYKMNLNDSIDKINVQFFKQIFSKTHSNNSITSISNIKYNSNYNDIAFITGDSKGNVVFWSDNFFELGYFFYTNVKEKSVYLSFPFVTSIDIKEDMIAWSYSNGSIILKKKNVFFEIGIHTRSIYSIYFDLDYDILYSCSFDSKINGIDYTKIDEDKIINFGNLEMKNKNICGLVYIDGFIFISCYDEKKLFQIKLNR